MTDINEIREYFKQDRFATENGMVIDEAGENYAKVSLVITPRHYNAVGGIMGGVFPALADFACAVASCHGEEAFVSADCRVSFINPVKGTKLIAETNCRKSGKNLAYYDVDITDDTGRLIATASFTMFRLK